MSTPLDWKADPYLPHSDVIARVGAATYRVTSWPPGMANPGSYTAGIGQLNLGSFPYTPEGRRAALIACQSHAYFVGDSLRAQEEIADRGKVSAQSA